MSTGQWRKNFIKEFADVWERSGGVRTAGLIAGYLLLDDTGLVTSAELSENLKISRGAVSMRTRDLLAAGFIRLRRQPHDRTHYFYMPEDVWESFLIQEQRYLERQQSLAARTLEKISPESPAYARVNNMERYMRWVAGLNLAQMWAAAKENED